MLKVAVLCGGPSLERGVSLNSARSLCDHLSSSEVEITPIYFDYQKNAYQISRSQLYSNTPSDFDFKLAQSGKSLSEKKLISLLKKIDIVFPAMHGKFGEDGGVQKLLEENDIPFVGSGSEACSLCFDKYDANNFIQKNGFHILNSHLFKIHENKKEWKKKLQKVLANLDSKRMIIKPATGGSSIGVHSVESVEDGLAAIQEIFSKRIDTRVVAEPFCTGVEFTVIILENRFGMPVAFIPSEIEIDYSKNQIFDYRKKYLSTNKVTYHCPPRFSLQTIEKIQLKAEQLFKLLKMRDFARFDGWLMEDGKIWFSDFNPISGMEQNSFLFMQSSQVGYSHQDLLETVLKNACSRYSIKFKSEEKAQAKAKKEINVLFGGSTAERQVSVMSGTNAWLKLRKNKNYQVLPYLLDKDEKTVWKLPYSKALNHTVEEISQTCKESFSAEERVSPLREKVLLKMATSKNKLTIKDFLPEKMTLNQLISKSDFLFIGLHGGLGENGQLQKKLEKEGVHFNGSSSKASEICIDKYQTGEVLKILKDQDVYIPPKKKYSLKQLFSLSSKEIKELWKKLKSEIVSKDLIVKPSSDGCSAGIVKLHSSTELEKYLQLLQIKVSSIPPKTFLRQYSEIEMPSKLPASLIFERFIQTDRVRVVNNEIKWEVVSNWIEVTVGLLGEKGKMKAFNPSITLANGAVLSLEEKFQGGTGVNITPPPAQYVKKTAVKKAKNKIELVAKTLGLEGYARIDSFMNTQSGDLQIIEANTTPALTPSTVLYQQALAEKEALYPTQLLEKIVNLGFKRYK